MERNPLRIVIRDLAGKIISADAVGRPMKFPARRLLRFPPNAPRRALFRARRQSRILRSPRTGLHVSGTPTSVLRNRPTRSTRAFPFFSPSTALTVTEFFSTTPGAPGLTSASRRATRYSFGAEGGPLDYYFLYGPSPETGRRRLRLSHRNAAAASAVGSWFPAVALQLHSRIADSRSRQPSSHRQNSLRRGLPRHRLPVQESPLHRRSQNFPQFSGPGFRSAQTAFPSSQHHRPAHRACRPTRATAPLRLRRSRKPVREKSRWLRVRRHRLARPRSVSGFHPRSNSRVVGRPLSRIRAEMASPDSGTT